MNVPVDLGGVGGVLESIRPWVTPVGIVGILGLLLRHQILNRRAKTEERRVEVDAEKGIRDHYSIEVAALRKAVVDQSARHRSEIAAVDAQRREAVAAAEERHEECQRSREELRRAFVASDEKHRKQIEALRDLVSGLQRVILQNSAAGVIALGDDVSPDVREAAERVEALFSPNASKEKDKGS